jgi:hypothetical protein
MLSDKQLSDTFCDTFWNCKGVQAS